MDTFLLSIGWWNFVGSMLMLGLVNENFGRKMLNEWTRIFKEDFKADYWVKLWVLWAAGLNIFFGLINIMAVKWNFPELKVFLAAFDVIAYCIFFLLTIWGITAGRLGSGVYSVFLIFGFWIGWGIYSLCC